MEVQFKKGVLEMCVLTLLSEKDFYSYELVKILNEYVPTADGTLYPLLRKLAKDGYLVTYLVESSEGPARKYFRITEDGKNRGEQLRKEWLKFSYNINLFLRDFKYNNDI